MGFTASQVKNEKIGITLIAIAAVIALISVLVQEPIAQDIKYHLFSDSKKIWHIPNFWNVVSNLPFLIVGILGLYKTTIAGTLKIINDVEIAYKILFIGLILLSFGSAYYHLWPDNQSLVWDRLAMTIVFMALLSIIISEFISVSIGKVLLFPLVIAGASSVVYWHFSETSGAGDLRYYALVQFFPMLVMPVILVCFRSRCSKVRAYWYLLALFVVAKIFEYFDGEVYNAIGVISGHSIKHIAVALGLYILLVSYERRQCI